MYLSLSVFPIMDCSSIVQWIEGGRVVPQMLTFAHCALIFITFIQVHHLFLRLLFRSTRIFFTLQKDTYSINWYSSCYKIYTNNSKSIQIKNNHKRESYTKPNGSTYMRKSKILAGQAIQLSSNFEVTSCSAPTKGRT